MIMKNRHRFNTECNVECAQLVYSVDSVLAVKQAQDT